MAEYWIQLHDYSSTTHKIASSSEAKHAFESFDWGSELASFDEDDSERNCPPGIGVSNGFSLTEDGAILLHVCPLDSDSVSLSVHCSRRVKPLGVFPRVKQAVKYVDSIEKSQVNDLIDLVFAGDSEALMAIE